MPETNNTKESKELKQLSEEELQFCELYVNGGLEFAVARRNVMSKYLERNIPKTPMRRRITL